MALSTIQRVESQKKVRHVVVVSVVVVVEAAAAAVIIHNCLRIHLLVVGRRLVRLRLRRLSRRLSQLLGRIHLHRLSRIRLRDPGPQQNPCNPVAPATKTVAPATIHTQSM